VILNFEGANGTPTLTNQGNSGISGQQYVGNAVISDEQAISGTSSLKVSAGTGNHLAFDAGAVWNPGIEDFTIETFFRFSGYWGGNPDEAMGLVSVLTTYTTAPAWGITVKPGNGSTIAGSIMITRQTGVGASTNITFSIPAGIALNTWHHIAWVRDGLVSRVYLNGVYIGRFSLADYVFTQSSSKFYVGTMGPSFSRSFLGYIDGFRFTVGACRYHGDFVPPAVVYPLVQALQ
jgi:hypothetical protein